MNPSVPQNGALSTHVGAAPAVHPGSAVHPCTPYTNSGFYIHLS